MYIPPPPPTYINNDFDWFLCGAHSLNGTVKNRRNSFPPLLNTGEINLVHPSDACTNMSVITSALCDNQGERCSLEDKNSDRNSFEDQRSPN